MADETAQATNYFAGISDLTASPIPEGSITAGSGQGFDGLVGVVSLSPNGFDDQVTGVRAAVTIDGVPASASVVPEASGSSWDVLLVFRHAGSWLVHSCCERHGQSRRHSFSLRHRPRYIPESRWFVAAPAFDQSAQHRPAAPFAVPQRRATDEDRSHASGREIQSIDRPGGRTASQRCGQGDQLAAPRGGRRGGLREAHARRRGAARRLGDRQLQHRVEAQSRRGPARSAGAAARWLGSAVRDTVKTLSDNNAAEAAGRRVVRSLLSNATGSLGASKPSKGVGHIIKPVARAGTTALEGGLEKAAIRYFASRGEKILRSKIGGSDRGIDIASYVGQGTGARLIISESKNLGGIVRGTSHTALGSGKQGVDRVNLERLESNLAAIRRSIENQVQDPTTRQTLLAQLDPGSQTGPILRLVGNTAKGTAFNESDIQEIVQDVSGVVKFQWPPVILNLTVPK